MGFKNPYPHAAPVSVYPTVEAMRDAYLEHRYRAFPRCARPRIGPLPDSAEGKNECERTMLAERRPTAHAIVIVPGRIVVMHFARRADISSVGRLNLERELVRSTPELAPTHDWAIEARLIYCDISAGVEEAVRSLDITLSRFVPRLLLTWRPRGYGAPRTRCVPRRFDEVAVRAFVAAHNRAPASPALREQRIANLRRGQTVMTPERRSKRASKANCARLSKLSAEERREIGRKVGAGLWGAMSTDERRAMALRLNAAKATKRADRMAIQAMICEPQDGFVERSPQKIPPKTRADRPDFRAMLAGVVSARSSRATAR